jgi:hypothetical protein
MRLRKNCCAESWRRLGRVQTEFKLVACMRIDCGTLSLLADVTYVVFLLYETAETDGWIRVP